MVLSQMKADVIEDQSDPVYKILDFSSHSIYGEIKM